MYNPLLPKTLNQNGKNHCIVTDRQLNLQRDML